MKIIESHKRSLNYAESKKKYFYKVRLLQHLYESKSTSVGALCKALSISTPTALNLLRELMKGNWVKKSGTGQSMGGRRPDLFGLKQGTFYALCIDIELFSIKIALLDNTHQECSPVLTIRHNLSKDREKINQIFTLANKLIKDSGIDKAKIIGVSIGMPGLTDPIKGENYSYFTSTAADKTLQQAFEEKFDLPVVLQNDVKGSAMAELYHGQAAGKKDTLVLLMDWGVGLGIIMDGKVRAGTSGFSGEMGHIPFVDNGDLCYCGKHGCLETVASGLALARMAKEGILSGKNSTLAELSEKEIDNIKAEVVIKAANKGDQYAIKLLSNIGTNMGKGISILIQLFNPELIILSGKIAGARQYITLPMQQAINTYCMTQIREKASIVSSELGENGRLLGYATSAFERYFDLLLTGD